jgi:SPP1 gp7 family putative phage head morphogenesis protein
MAKTANEELADAMLRHQIYLLRYGGYVRNRMLAVLDKTNEDILEKILSRLATNTGLNTTVEWKRLNALMDSIERTRSQSWDDAQEQFKEDVVALAKQEPIFLANIVQVTLPVQIDVVMPSANLLRSIALSQPFQGKILSEWASGMEATELTRIHNAIQLGMTAGEDMQTIARRVVGTANSGFQDGVLNMTRNDVESVTRTAVMHVSNHARRAWFDENSDVIDTERYVATLDSRTTPICRANDGKLFPLGTGPQPPLHFRCRSLRIAAIDGTLAGERPAKPFVESQLVGEYADANGLGSITSRDKLPYGTKGDYDKWARGRIRELVGPVPATTTYQTWLKGQSATFQDEILGKTKGKLFRDGGLQLDKFVNRNGDELTLSQLASKHADAFTAAGLDPENF